MADLRVGAEVSGRGLRRPVWLISLPSLAAYEQYRGLFGKTPTSWRPTASGMRASACLRHQRTFMRRFLPGGSST
jgi:hypothetical protein